MNFKFLPFVIGMALVSTAANAADGNFSNLTVTNSATFRNNLSANKLNVEGSEGMTISIPTGAGSDYQNFITGKNNK